VEGTALIAQDYGMKITMDMTDPNTGKTTRQEQYILPQEKTMLAVMPNEKQYVRMELNDALVKKARQQSYDPGSMLEKILNCTYQSLGRSTLDGVEVEGFQTTDPNYLAGMVGQTDVKIWIDVKTQLPVRMDMDIQMEAMQMHGVMHDYQWGVPVTEADFHPVIPDDYTTLPGGPMKMPAMDEQGAIDSLKLYADLTGRYPEKLDILSLMAEFSKRVTDSNNPALSKDNPVFKKMVEGTKGASMEERSKVMTDLMLKIQGAGMFYTLLLQEKKSAAYYGNVVTPQDVDQVLLRWKVSDNEYRVIFGGLHAETVSADTLAELEKTIPK
jgi:hypothetical protein